jgi:quercetin dioxygenase-like cupin family protein
MNGSKPFRTNLKDVPLEPNLKEEDGWINMQVQFLINEATADSKRTVVGWTVLPPGASHERHRHHNADEFWIVLKGQGVMYTDAGEEPSVEGDVVFTPAGFYHGFRNTSDDDVVLVWGWSGAGSLDAAGYELPK